MELQQSSSLLSESQPSFRETSFSCPNFFYAPHSLCTGGAAPPKLNNRRCMLQQLICSQAQRSGHHPRFNIWPTGDISPIQGLVHIQQPGQNTKSYRRSAFSACGPQIAPQAASGYRYITYLYLGTDMYLYPWETGLCQGRGFLQGKAFAGLNRLPITDNG